MPRPIPLVDRSRTDRAHADNLHGDRLPAGNAAANEPMCPDARGYIKARVEDALRESDTRMHIRDAPGLDLRSHDSRRRAASPQESNVPVARCYRSAAPV
ncbi:unnamed protein product [Lasius platythorax]|uniref:Uncharacterized protein n=1 Tax=Lasius platythorax TaxID=488582 RepID=A0AAV2NR50_9HYME